MSNIIYFCGGRGTGKTRKMFEFMKEHHPDGVILCKYPDRMAEKARSYGITGLKFDYYDAVPPYGTMIAIHNLAEYAELSLGSPVVSCTLTTEEN